MRPCPYVEFVAEVGKRLLASNKRVQVPQKGRTASVNGGLALRYRDFGRGGAPAKEGREPGSIDTVPRRRKPRVA